MALNPNIILAGQLANPTNALMQGAEAAQAVNQVRDQNALRDLYAQQGPGIANGDQNALNALAGLSPQAAMDAQASRLGMDLTKQNISNLRQQAAREAQQQAAKMSADEAKAAAERISGVLQGAMAAPDEASYNTWLQQNNLDPMQYPFAQRDMNAAKLMGYKDVLDVKAKQQEMAQGPKPADEYGRYAQEELAAGRKPLSRIEYKRAGQKTQQLSVDKDGNVSLSEGFGGPPVPKLTVDAAKNTGFLIRAQDSQEILNGIETQGTDFWQQSLDAVPMGLGNYARTPEFQKYDQARRDFVNALLRRESGAVISDSEFDNAEKQYFPVPGDKPEVIEQKRRNRENAIAGLRVGSGEGAAYVDQMPKPSQGDSEQGPKKVASDSDYDALPSGATFIAPDGTTRRKP